MMGQDKKIYLKITNLSPFITKFSVLYFTVNHSI